MRRYRFGITRGAQRRSYADDAPILQPRGCIDEENRGPLVSQGDMYLSSVPPTPIISRPTSPSSASSSIEETIPLQITTGRGRSRLRSMQHSELGTRHAQEGPQIITGGRGRNLATGRDMAQPLPPAGRGRGLLQALVQLPGNRAAPSSQWSALATIVNALDAAAREPTTPQTTDATSPQPLMQLQIRRPEGITEGMMRGLASQPGCWNCHKYGHRYSRCPERRRPFCYGCGTPGQKLDECANCAQEWERGERDWGYRRGPYPKNE